MGPVTVVILLPCVDLGSGVGKRREQHLVQELVSEAAIEALNEPILHGLSRCDVVPGNVGPLTP